MSVWQCLMKVWYISLNCNHVRESAFKRVYATAITSICDYSNWMGPNLARRGHVFVDATCQPPSWTVLRPVAAHSDMSISLNIPRLARVLVAGWVADLQWWVSAQWKIIVNGIKLRQLEQTTVESFIVFYVCSIIEERDCISHRSLEFVPSCRANPVESSGGIFFVGEI